MTEKEWLSATDPRTLIRFVDSLSNERKLRLFGSSCGRKLFTLLVDERSRRAIEISEEFADSNATVVELKTAQIAAGEASDTLEEKCVEGGPADAEDLWCAAEAAWEIVAEHPDFWGITHSIRDSLACVGLLRDIFGNPFCPIILNRSWLTPNVTGLAKTIYDDRQLPSGLFDNQRMGVLADALEDAGCDNVDILQHLRGGGEHVRGCWVVDGVLGKE